MRRKDKGAAEWRSSTSRALSKVCRKRWRTLPLAAGSPSPPMRINCANALLGGELYLFGGLNAGPSKSLWALNVRERRWRPIPAKRGQAPDPRQGHTMCWDGRWSLWVFGGQGATTSSADSSRTHQGVKIRTLAKRTCFNDFFEFDTRKEEWRDHVQAGVCPTSRRGHTATLVLGRCTVEPVQHSFADGGGGDGAGASTGGDGSDGSDSSQTRAEAAEGGGNHHIGSKLGSSPQPGRAMASEQVVESRLHLRGSRKAGGRGGTRPGGDEGMKPCESREMFVIGGAGTDPIRNMEVVYPQLWIFSFDRSQWTCVEATGGNGGTGGPKAKGCPANGSGGSGGGSVTTGPGPPAVFDHTATLTGGTHIVVIGGVMVGREVNNQVYMLALDTLQWSTVVSHPLGFAPPSLHGHTAVEDPTYPRRIIVFGGRGGKNWNTQVLTFECNKQLWSMAVCDTAPPEERTMSTASEDAGDDGDTTIVKGESSQPRVTIKEETSSFGTKGSDAEAIPVADLTATTTTTTNSKKDEKVTDDGQRWAVSSKRPPAGILASSKVNSRAGSKLSSSKASVATSDLTRMPHQRHGHTCFVWDPRNFTHANSGSDAAGGGKPNLNQGGRFSPPSSIGGISKGKNNRGGEGGGGGGGGSMGKSSPERPRGGGGIGSGSGSNNKINKAGLSQQLSPSRTKGGHQGGGGSRHNNDGGHDNNDNNDEYEYDESLPSPCIVTFGGSALRHGGGYAQADLHVLETPEPVGGGGGSGEEEGSGEEDGRVLRGTKGKRAVPTAELLRGLGSIAGARKRSFSKFQTCTKSVILKVQSLRQLGKENLTFGDPFTPGDMSYVEFKVRSVIFGEKDTKPRQGSGIGCKDDDGTMLAAMAAAASGGGGGGGGGGGRGDPAGKTTAAVDKSHPGAGGLGVFPVGYEQVKAFLADARPASMRRPVSAPAHLDPGGSNGGGGINDGGGGGGGAADKTRAGGRGGTNESKRPGTTGAAPRGEKGGRHGSRRDHQLSSLPPIGLRELQSSSLTTLGARPGSRTSMGGAGGAGGAGGGGGGGSSAGSFNGNRRGNPPSSACAMGGFDGSNIGEAGTRQDRSLALTSASAGSTGSCAGNHSVSGDGSGGGSSIRNPLFYHRSCPRTDAGGVEMTGGGVPMQGNKPLLLPRSTMAVHNGRLRMEHEWGNAGVL